MTQSLKRFYELEDALFKIVTKKAEEDDQESLVFCSNKRSKKTFSEKSEEIAKVNLTLASEYLPCLKQDKNGDHLQLLMQTQ